MGEWRPAQRLSVDMESFELGSLPAMTLPAKTVSLAEWCNASKENGNTKPKVAPRARYTLEFKQEAVGLVE